MSETNHQALLIETARSELARAHQGALAMQAGDMRRGLEMALAALREAGAPSAAKVAEALADLDGGQLVEMERLIEAVRTELEA